MKIVLLFFIWSNIIMMVDTQAFNYLVQSRVNPNILANLIICDRMSSSSGPESTCLPMGTVFDFTTGQYVTLESLRKRYGRDPKTGRELPKSPYAPPSGPELS